MHNITFDLATLHEHGPAFFEYLKLRKQFFVDQLNWAIPHNDNYEMDQYDNPTAFYSLVLSGKFGDSGPKTVLGGARVMATDAVSANHTFQTFMMGDAREGKISDIPGCVGDTYKASPETWEMTRLVISDDLISVPDRRTCVQLICDGVIDIARMNGCTRLLGLSSLSLLRVLRQLGYGVDRVGECYRDPNDGRKYTAMQMEFPPMASMLLAAE